MIRDAEYMNWRYLDGPDRYEVFRFQRGESGLGFLVLKQTTRRGQPCGDVVDVLHPKDDRETLDHMLRWAVDWCEDAGCVLAQTWFLAEGKLAADLRAAGFRWRRAKVPFLLSPDSPYAAVYEPSQWTLFLGDGNDI